MIELNNEVLGGVVFGICIMLVILIPIYNKYLHLMSWLTHHAPMTLETYKRLGDKHGKD